MTGILPSTGVVALDSFDPEGSKYMRQLFPGLIEQGHPLHSSWRDHAIGLLVAKTKVTEEDIRQCKKLKYVVRHGVGYDNIDIAACARHGIRVSYCPGINAANVAELALSLVCASAKNLVELSRQMRAGEKLSKRSKSLYSAAVLTGKTFGIVGGGLIGQMAAKKFVGAFDAKVILYDPYVSAEDKNWARIPHTRAETIEKLLPVVDVLSLHVPLTSSTTNLINLSRLRSMKPTAILVNTSRGGVVNEDDLWTALREDIIASAGIDVWVHEPPTREVYGDVFDLPNLVISPHIGGSPAEIQTMTCIAMCDRMKEMMDGKEPLHVVV